MSPQIKASADSVRSSYAFLFSVVVQIYRIHYPDEKPGTRFEEVRKITETMMGDGLLDENTYETLQSLYREYPSMLPTAVAENFRRDAQREAERIDGLNKRLLIAISELSEDLHDLIEEDQAEYLRDYLRNH